MSAAIPVPLPPPLTCTTTPGFLFMYSSAKRWPRMTMVSEPRMVRLRNESEGVEGVPVDVCSEDGRSPPHASARTMNMVETTRAFTNRRFMRANLTGGGGEDREGL